MGCYPTDDRYVKEGPLPNAIMWINPEKFKIMYEQ